MRKFLDRLWQARRAIVFYGVLLTLGWIIGSFLMEVVVPEMRPMNEPTIHRMVMAALVVFVITAAIPFVPGAEIGFALLILFGGQASFLVYTGMVGALILSYTIARLVPLTVLSRFAGWLGLARVSAICRELAETDGDDRADLVTSKLKGRVSHTLMRNRYVLLIVLLNLPGNSVLGGGGGIAFLAGASGLYQFWPFLISILIAIAPVPLAFYLLAS